MKVILVACAVLAMLAADCSAVSLTAVSTFADANWNCADIKCTTKVAAGSAQPNYQCAEFVSRSLVAGGYITGLTKTDAQSKYQSYSYGGATYNLLCVSSKGRCGVKGLEDLLIKLGWKSCGVSSTCVKTASAIFTDTYGHVTVGVGSNLIDSHNNARYHVALSFYGTPNSILVPP